MNVLQAATQATEALTAATEVATVWGTRAYVLGGEIFSITAILWCVNFMATATERVYNAGAATGTFYKTHVHQHTLALIALVVLGGQLAYEGAVWVHDNRDDIIAHANTLRNRVGDAFAYHSPVVA